jgi:hypothetical protein
MLAMKMRRVFSRSSVLLVLASAVLMGCDELISTEPPTGFTPSPDPNAFDNEQGTLELYRGVINRFREATSGRITPGGYIVMSGMLGDELSAGKRNTTAFSSTTVVDSRVMSSTDPAGLQDGYDGVWRQLHGVRMQAMTTIEALRKFGPNQPRDLTGHLFGLWGMAEVMLANFFCSGIPLTTVNYDGSFRLARGSTTVEVYEHAIAMFDSAMANTPDSVGFRNLAKVGKGWALLNLGRFADAAAAVADVPTTFTYMNYHSTAMLTSTGTPNFTSGSSSSTPHAIANMGTVADREGGTGLPYRSSGDPRTLSPMVRDAVPTSGDDPVYKPARWMVNGGDTPIIMASGVEARLIEAEAALQAGDPMWLTILNSLRTSGEFTTSPNPDDPTVVDTTWAPGEGAILFTSIGGSLPGLRPLEDPGTEDARVDLLFQERAYWLFLTGRRHADMRRLIRQYGRSEATVFPQGAYPAGPIGTYGVDVNAPAPGRELLFNPQYQGCFDRQA